VYAVHAEPCTGTETALFETKFALLLVFFLFMFLRRKKKSVETAVGF
jgi:hypothetical protein